MHRKKREIAVWADGTSDWRTFDDAASMLAFVSARREEGQTLHVHIPQGITTEDELVRLGELGAQRLF